MGELKNVITCLQQYARSDKEAMERQCKTDNIKKSYCFFIKFCEIKICLKSSGRLVDYNSLLSDCTLRRNLKYFKNIFIINMLEKFVNVT